MNSSILTIKVEPIYFNQWPQLSVCFNKKNIFCNAITDKEDIILNINHQEKNKLEIGLTNKRFGKDNMWDTKVDENRNIVNDLLLKFNDILIDDISVIDIFLKNMYYVDDTLGQPVKNQKIRIGEVVGFNGFFEFEYEMPLLNSIINQKFKVPINRKKSNFTNFTKKFHYDDDLRLIEEIESILDEAKKLNS